MEGGRHRVSPFARAIVEWLRTTATPPPGVELSADDGSTYTGIVVVENNRVVLMLATNHAERRRATFTSFARPSPTWCPRCGLHMHGESDGVHDDEWQPHG